MAKRSKKDPAVLTVRPLRAGDALFHAGHRRELQRRTAKIGKLKARTDIEQWREGFEYLVIRDKKLYFQDGYAHMSEWLAHHELRGRTAVKERMRFAENFSLEQVREYGKERLDLALKYASMTVTDDAGWQVESLVVKIPEGDGVVSRPFAKLAAWQLEAAIAHQAGLVLRRLEESLPETQRPLLDSLEAAVRDDERQLARVSARPAESRDPDDTVLKLEMRAADLLPVLQRLLQVVAKRDPTKPRNH